MADRLRIVTFSPGGRPITQLDINTGSTFALVRDTLKFDAPQRNQQLSESPLRYDGSRITAETHSNATLSAEWYINAGSTADASLALMETLFSQFESIAPDRYVEWRPEGATKSTFYEIRGPAPWDFMYRWIEFQATKTLHVKGGWTIAPLGEGERMEIDDPFDVNSLTDYTALVGSGMAYTAGTGLTTSSTANQFLKHTGRGYNYGDNQTTIKFTTGTALGTATINAVVCAIDANNYVEASADFGAGQLTVHTVSGGTLTNVGNVALGTLSTFTTYWLVGRKDGNTIYVELWNSAPTPMGTPLNSTSATLSGGTATQFGFGVTAAVGLRIQLSSTAGWSINEFIVEPYTYRSKNTPQKIQLGGAIPGDAPAAVTVSVSASGSPNPVFGMFGWAPRPATGASPAPFGVLEAENATTVTTFSNNSITGGSSFTESVTTSGPGSGSLLFNLLPSLMTPDDFARGEVDIEVWGHVYMDAAVVSPQVTVSLESAAGQAFGGVRYTVEYGSVGKTLTRPSSGAVWRFMRLGTLSFDTKSTGTWNLRVYATWGAGSTGVFGFDYFVLVPSNARASSPTGKSNDATYPAFTKSTSATTRVFKPLGPAYTGALPSALLPDAALGGAPFWFPPGNVDVLAKFSSLVPDDPSSSAASETAASGAYTPVTMKFSPVPRYFLPRGT